MKDNSCKQGINIDNQIDPKTITISTSADLFEIKDDAMMIQCWDHYGVCDS